MVMRCCRPLARTRCAGISQAPVRNQGYHSYEHAPVPPYSSAEESILSASIKHVPTHGFTATALIHGARDAGYLDVSANLLPAGAFSLVKYHLVTQRLALGKPDSAPPAAEPTKVLDNVRALALRRLRANESIIHRWQEVCFPAGGTYPATEHLRMIANDFAKALAILAMPKHIPDSLRELALLSDEIHFLAGDTSVDTAWYTKRAGLSAIYASTELFMTQDKSINFKDTEEFLDRRLESAQGLRIMMGEVGRWAGVQGMGVISGLRSKGVRI
ncbi:MAG: hypothetical protein L6R39_000648 [Caloplaca ligustica]|nr:MAG: hypothetical protein L6R39_000648 [Caloplaca ligustica]